MIISASVDGIDVTYRCFNPRYGWIRKCPDQYTAKCRKCKYCIAEMPAADATKLLNVFRGQKTEIHKK